MTSTKYIKSFFHKSLCKGTWISFIVFKCDNPIYRPGPCAFCFVRSLGYLSLSLGGTTLRITPVTLPYMVKRLLHIGGVLHPFLGMPTAVNEWMNLHIGYWIQVTEILLWEFQLMACSSIASCTVTESTWARGLNRLIGSWRHVDPPPPYNPNLCVCEFVCLFVCLCVR